LVTSKIILKQTSGGGEVFKIRLFEKEIEVTFPFKARLDILYLCLNYCTKLQTLLKRERAADPFFIGSK
jgi:hypothetical protein